MFKVFIIILLLLSYVQVAPVTSPNPTEGGSSVSSMSPRHGCESLNVTPAVAADPGQSGCRAWPSPSHVRGSLALAGTQSQPRKPESQSDGEKACLNIHPEISIFL